MSRSRSRLQSGASSGSALEIAPVPITARTTHSSDAAKNSSARVLQITQLVLEDISRVVWQGQNNLYCTLALSQWEHRTPTKPEAGDSANWNEITIEIPLDMEGGSSTHGRKSLGALVIVVSHENLVVVDKVIGQAELTLSSIFCGDVGSDKYTCPEPVDVVQTVYEGTKVKRKMKGLVKFQARIVFAPFDVSFNRTKMIIPLSQRDKMEFKLDSATGSIATQSIDPYAIREDSGPVYDFSSTQLRNAADLLLTLEASPATGATGSNASKTSKQSPFKPTSASSSRGDVRAGDAEKVPSRSSKPNNIQQQHQQSQSLAAASAPAPGSLPVKVPAAASSLSQPRRSFKNPATDATGASKHSGAQGSESSKLASTASDARTKTPTRLRTRRVGADETTADYNDQPEKEVGAANLRKSSVGKLVAAQAAKTDKGDNLNRTAPARVTSDYPKHETNKLTSALPTTSTGRSLGYHVVDEAFRLAMKKKGAYLRLTMSEVVSLLSTLGFTVRSDMMQIATCLSQINKEQASLPVAAAGDSHVSLPIVHSMSLAATISFLVRDHSLLRDNGEGERRLGTMSELQAEIALKQLISLVEGTYAEIKKFIVGVCGGGSQANKASPTAVIEVSNCRPSAWSAHTTQAFLRLLNIHIPHEASAMNGEALLELDQSAAFRSQFGGNPSVDLTRLAVYTQALRFLDSWWDRGIRPGDSYDRDSSHLTEDKSLKRGAGGGNKRSKSKRRGSKQSVSSKFGGDWGDLSAVQDQLQDDNSSVQDSSRLGTKIVDGGRVIQSHLLKIADFQPLLEAITPLNRAFGWGCSLEALVRFASIVGGMRAHLWVASGSDPCRSNSSCGDLSYLDNTVSSTGNILPSGNQDDIGRWVVLQKCSAPSTSELTQLVKLCNDLNIVMKYASREDDFLAFLPTNCLRITSVQEVRSRNFKADLEGLLLDDICVGRKVVVADLNALTRTCERFDWWDRPSPAVLEGMCNQTGEVISLAEVQEKRRVGVKILNSGVCDALPLEALRLCTDEELALLAQKEEQDREEASKPPPPPLPQVELAEVATKSQGRRKSKSTHNESRKTKLRTLISNLNIVKKEVQEVDIDARKAHPIKSKAAAPLAVLESAVEEVSIKSELSNLSGEAELEKIPVRTSLAKKKKTASGPPSPLNSPQKRIVRRSMVHNNVQPASPICIGHSSVNKPDTLSALDVPPAVVDCNAPPAPAVDTSTAATTTLLKHPIAASSSAPVKSAASTVKSSGRSSPVIQVSATVRASPELSNEHSLVTRWSAVETAAADYSWLKGPARSPITFTDDEPPVISEPAVPLLPRPVQAAEEKKTPHGPAPLHIIQASFDAERAEYTEGVLPARATSAGITRTNRAQNASAATAAGAASADETDEPEVATNQFRSKFVRTNRPQSASSMKGRGKRPGQVAASGEDPERTEPVDKCSSFGLAGVGYAGGGKLQPHANLWVNEDIPAVPEAEVPRVIPNKQLVHSKDYRTQTEKLFEFHGRTVVHSPQRGGSSGATNNNNNNKKGDHFVDIMLAAPNEGGSLSPPGKRNTVRIRPRSANPVSRGVTSAGKRGGEEKYQPNIDLSVGPAAAGATATGSGAVGQPGDDTAGAAANKATTRPKSASGRPKRTREEELLHIATSRANRELSLKEKVLQKELKRIEVHGNL